jgi:superfamily II DNA/RNA helicase
MGFRPAVDRIVAACPDDRQTLFFSATLDGEAGAIAKSYTRDAASHERGPTKRAAAAEIEHRFVSVTHEGRLDALVDELEADRELTLVFVRTKRGADRLVKRLAGRGIEAVAMHGDKSQRQRERALAQFENGVVDTLVATDVAARGIDVEGISHVIQFDPPDGDDSYVHRVGRTGRAGRSGVGVTLVSHAERGDIVKLAGRLGIEHGLSRTTHDRAADAHPRTPQSDQRAPRSDRRTPQSDQRAPQSDRRSPQGGPRSPQGGPRSPQGGPRRPQSGSRRPQAGSRGGEGSASSGVGRSRRPRGPRTKSA